VVTTIATDGTGLGELLTAIAAHRRHLSETGALHQSRRDRAMREIEAAVRAGLRRRAAIDHAGDATLDRVVAREMDPWSAAESVIDAL